MIQAKDIAIQFKKDLDELLRKYDAEIGVEERGTIHYERGLEDIIVYIQAKYDKDGNCIAEWAEVNLGRNIQAN